jgi:hypothetical protein
MRIVIILLLLAGLGLPVSAQADCGTADRLDFPVDRAGFALVQGYGVPSVRHQGRYHTGEDWALASGGSAGQPVQAIATGRVSYSDPRVWGRDGGVVIVEHVFSDGTTAYSMYGHLSDEAYPFPVRYTCVTIGQILGGIAAGPRPAPHLHFEVRTSNPDTPGAGYTREQPDTVGYTAPTAFILNQQTYLRPSYAFHTRIPGGIAAPPVPLTDNSLLVLDTRGSLRRVLPDGRILWRTRLTAPAVHVTAFQGSSYLVLGDGRWQSIDVETGSLAEAWRIAGFNPIGAAFELVGWQVYPLAGDRLAAVDETRRSLVWTLDGIPPFVRAFVANEGVNAVFALLTRENEVIRVAGAGVELGRTTLRYPASFAQNSRGDLLIYSWGGLWQVDLTQEWREYLAVPHGGESGALWRESGRLLVFDGQRLLAYDAVNAPLWEVSIPGVSGAVEMRRYGSAVLLVSTGGTIAAIGDSGVVCNQAQTAPAPAARLWHGLLADNVLRVAVGDQIVGFDWGRFTQGCA